METEKSVRTLCHIDSNWIGSEECKALRHAAHLVIFKYDPSRREQFLSPSVKKYLAGNYDGRLFSDVLLEDHVVYPGDIDNFNSFLEHFQSTRSCEHTLRLLTRCGCYHWFKICLTFLNGFYFGVLIDISSGSCPENTLLYRAEYDNISGIYNRVTFYEKTQLLLSRHPDTLHYLIRFDIQHFKLINELYSTAEGDRVLFYIGTLLRLLVHRGETYGRLDNDIFCMCVTRSRQDLPALLETLQKKGNEYPLEFRFIFSIGILEIAHYNGEAISILCDHAAIAQHTTKGNYIKPYAFYTQKMSRMITREQALILQMEHALSHKEFHVYFQPRFHIRTHEIVGAEALVRWIPPGKPMIPPDEFIPLFEQNGFILHMDTYVWEETCRTIRSWMDRGIPVFPVSVNISRIHLYDTGFCDKIVKLLQKYDLPPRLLELEITESAYMECQDTLLPIMEKLQQKGFQFLMDDFGSGYSSLNSLKDIPVDIIKMDMNFLQHSRRGPEIGYKILQGAIRLIQDLGLPIVIEGVENKDQEQFLIRQGCQEAQGYYYARPMSTGSFEQLIQLSYNQEVSADEEPRQPH